ncbi:uncharacterized protein LJ264_014500 [Porphyrio hochstetteri]
MRFIHTQRYQDPNKTRGVAEDGQISSHLPWLGRGGAGGILGMEETRDHSGLWGAERSQRAGYSLERKPEARVACQAVVAALFLALLVTAVAFAAQAFQPRPRPCFRCPFDWVGYRGRCYHFSEAEGNWTSSQENCSALGASLAMLDSVEDLSFVVRSRGGSGRWVGLSREDEEQPWTWVNRSRLAQPWGIRGRGLCAFLSDSGLDSSRCDAARSWVCSKPEPPSPTPERRRAQNLSPKTSTLGRTGNPHAGGEAAAALGKDVWRVKPSEMPAALGHNPHPDGIQLSLEPGVGQEDLTSALQLGGNHWKDSQRCGKSCGELLIPFLGTTESPPAWIRTPIPCPEGWVGFSQRCYLASEAEGNWSVSWGHCRSMGATLAGIDSAAEMDFLQRCQGLSAHWLRIPRNGTAWVGLGGAEHNSSRWPIRGDGGCAYLNEEKGVSSSRCSTERPWICSAQAGAFPGE